MKRYTASTLPVIVLLTGFVLGPVALQAKDHGCSTVTAAGNWAFSDTGSIIGLGPFGAIGTFTLDAAGNVSGEQTNSVNGKIPPDHLKFAGTYTVNSDCTGTASNLDV